MPNIPKKLKRVTVVGLLALLVVVLAGVILGIVYEEEVKQRIVQEVNQGLNTEITVEEISLTVLQKFPNAALRFESLMALDAIETNAPKDTLLYAGDLFLEFNLFDIFTRNYTIRKVEVANAVLRLKVDENGNDNFHFWKEKSDTSSAHVSFQLNEVVFNNVDFSYRSVQAGFHLNTQIDDLSLSGNFQEAVFDLEAKSSLLVQILEADETVFLQNQKTKFAVSTRIDTRNNRYEFADGSITFGNLEFKVGGAYQAGSETHLDLHLDGENFDIPELLSFIPRRFIEPLDGYEPRGRMSFGLHVHGDPSSRDEVMEIAAEFAVEKAGVKHVKSGLNFKDFSASGRYKNRGDHPDIIELDQFNFKLKEGYLSGSGSLRNFSRPMIEFRLEGKAQLADLQNILELPAIESISGAVELECRFKGIVANPDKLSVNDLQRADISGKLNFSGTQFKIRNHDHRYHGFNGEFHLNGNNAAFKQLRGNIYSSDFVLDGVFVNFVPFVLIEKERMTIQASLQSKKIDLAELLVSGSDKSDNSDFNFHLPKYVDLNLSAAIGQLTFRTFTARDIFGNIRMNHTGIFADPLRFNTSQGKFTAGMNVTPKSENKYLIDTHAEIRDINIQQLFHEFGNFGQDFITDQHLRGVASADVVFRSDIDGALKLDEKSIYSLVDINITNGELVRMQSLIEVADYIRQHKLLSVVVKTQALKERLEHVEFSKLENQIEIKNSTVHIPEMQLESSAMDLAVSGTHSFNSEVDYRLRFRLTEILTNPKNSEFGEIEDDGSGGSFFLRMNGPLSDLNFAYDKAAARERRKEYFQKEKETLKELLKEEFNIFGKKKDKEKSGSGNSGSGTIIEVETDDEPEKTEEKNPEVILQPEKPKESEKETEEKDDDFWDALEDDDDF